VTSGRKGITMATPVILPQMSDTMTEGTLVRWLKAEGDEVEAGDPIAEVETDKAVMELEAPVRGTLLRVFVSPDTVVSCGTRVALIGAPGEEGEDEPPAAPPLTESRVHASPAARKLASRSNIDIRRVPGSGPGGRVVLRDVAAAAAKVLKEPTPSSWEFPRQRSVMVSRLVSSHQEIPTFTVTRTIQMDHALAFRKLQTESGAFPEGLGITELCVAAAARASGAEPRLNARYSDGRVILQETVNIGIAVGLEDFVVVPVIQRCNALTLKRIAAEYRRIVAAAKGGSLLPDDARDGTFTVSNLGMLGVEQFSAIINPPEAAILAVGAIRREICFEVDRIEARNVMSVTLTVDHRVADGLHAARWLQEFARALENPGQMLAI